MKVVNYLSGVCNSFNQHTSHTIPTDDISYRIQNNNIKPKCSTYWTKNPQNSIIQ